MSEAIRVHVVRAGDCIESIAARYQCDWRRLWEHATNRDLRARRSDPNVLAPGDAVHIPASLLPQPTAVRPGGSHALQHTMARTTVRVRLVRDGDPSRPLANTAYVVRWGGERVTGTTDGDGRLEAAVPPTLGRAVLVIAPGTPDERSVALHIGHLDPVDHEGGVAQRLRNLGFLSGLGSPEQVRAALARFAAQHGGGADRASAPETLEHLARLHGG